jgi:23S rRNA pseudouridine1911/1915/1917 synthase
MSELKEESENDFVYQHYQYEVDKGQTVIRIDKYLVDKVERATRSKIQKACADDLVRVNGKPVKANHKVKPNDKIEVTLPKPANSDHILPQDIPLDIRYEDDHLMVIYKPPGLVVHPGVGNHTGTLVNGLVYYLNKQKENNDMPIMEGNPSNRPGIVHRIDKNTSGLMVVAKSEHAMTHLAKQFFDHTIERKYIALIWGEFDEKEGTIEGNIGRHPRHRLQMTVFPDGEEGKHAVTHFKVIEPFYYVSLVECILETGRTHQIRVHMKEKGHPLFNDERYGGNHVVKGTVFSKYKTFVQNCFDLMPRHALHAKSLGFIHPETGEKMYFETDTPADFVAVLEKWRKYVNSKNH